MDENKNELNFEQAGARLEEIVRSLETGKATLDESIRLYEEGVMLVRIASEKLCEAKSKITMVSPKEEENE